MGEINIVPRKNVSFREVAEFGKGLGWKIDKKSVAAAEGEESPEYLWRVGSGSRVKLVQSNALNRDYFVVSGPDTNQLDSAIRARYPSYSESEILATLAAAEAKDERRVALKLVGAAEFRQYNEAVYQAVERGLRDDSEVVRVAALMAAFSLRWRQLRPLLEQVSVADPAESVRNTGQSMLGLTNWDRG